MVQILGKNEGNHSQWLEPDRACAMPKLWPFFLKPESYAGGSFRLKRELVRPANRRNPQKFSIHAIHRFTKPNFGNHRILETSSCSRLQLHPTFAHIKTLRPSKTVCYSKVGASIHPFPLVRVTFAAGSDFLPVEKA